MKFSWIRVATMKHIIFILLTVAILSGCAAQRASLQNSSLSPAMQADVAKPLHCQGAEECKVMWKRALRFISLNADYEIKTANASLIETEQFQAPFLPGYRHLNDKTALSMAVHKIPRDNGKYELQIWAWCLNEYKGGCVPNVWETIWRAQLFIREGRE
jgi:hypothetical protein